MHRIGMRLFALALTGVLLVLCVQPAYARLVARPSRAPDSATWAPRRVEPSPPEGLTFGGVLDGEGIASDYTMGAQVVMQPQRRAFVEDHDGEWALRAFYPDGGEWKILDEYRAAGEISNVVAHGEDMAYLVGKTAYTFDDETYFLELLPWEGERSSLVLGPSKRERAPYIGPMLCTKGGILLFADTLGKLYTCSFTEGLLDQVSDVTVQEFVWHDGFIYFTNMQDQVTYQGVFCEEYGEYLDIAYPRLYRMRMDGTEMTRLTDGGVKGLVSQGKYIVYQNLDDAFALGMRVMPEPWEWLCGKLWLLDADTGKHRPLNMEAEKYAATPHGLAVFYTKQLEDAGDHEERVLAGAALFDYEGKALHLLDVPPENLYVPFTVTKEAIVYWADEYERTSVRLNGSPEVDGL